MGTERGAGAPGAWPEADAAADQRPLRQRVAKAIDLGVRRYEPIVLTVGAVMAIVLAVTWARGDTERISFAPVPVTVAPSEAQESQASDVDLDSVDEPVSFGGASAAPPMFDQDQADPASPPAPPASAAARADGPGDASVLARLAQRPTDVLVGPAGPGGNVFAAYSVSGAGTVVLLDPSGQVVRRYPLGAGTGTASLAPGPAGSVLVAAPGAGAVLRLDPASGKVAVHVALPDVPPCLPAVLTANCDATITDAPPTPYGLAHDASGNLYVSDSSQGAVWRLAAGSSSVTQLTVEQNWVDGGESSGPRELAVDGAGNVVLAVADIADADAGVVVIVPVQADGVAGEVVELARFADATQPTGLALSAAGNVYVALHGADTIVVLAPDGSERRRIPGRRGVLKDPVGLGFAGSALFAAAGAPQGDGGAVVRLPTGEQGAVLPAP